MFVAKWYTRASRVRIVIAKFDGRWKLPGGPYPIPELVALVVGIMLTLFLLPRLGQPVITGVVGISVTAIAVGAMRKMPYSPVPFGTRAHRIARLYTSPVSVSTGDESHAVNTVSTVRPQIEVLDMATEHAPAYASSPHRPSSPSFTPATDTDEWSDMFGGQQRSAAADLFG
ncbi:hypothetical protein A7U43_28235 (plasmid) [Mycobacterium adipatum]|uniref:Uncharacterized protein n=1 Tax=Mycobacterium adipatum TaxID=1682113 RepID=A0A172UWQ3_9MYCO|nr:hypothetical protein [Mycobacterium adipatum]ANE83410.1 hypothetical protein A7U43_28235 [Mycobacterium adipatum]